MRGLYTKLAVTNLKKNYQIYVPYIITCFCTIMTFYILRSLALNRTIYNIRGGQSVAILLEMGSQVVGLFSFIFLLYANSFVIKRRKKEMGLYSILGMEKKHIARVMLVETLICSIVSILIGIAGGILFNKLVFMILLRILSVNIPMGFYFNFNEVKTSLILFGILFLITLVINVSQVQFLRPIELITGGKKGEKEPKTKILMTIAGIVTLSLGYLISVQVKSTGDAFDKLFGSIVLVMAGTYFLFISGSIAFLKLLRKNKKYYYKTKNFISVSGMLYRMKQNAVGLASICILSTAVMVLASSGVALYAGSEYGIHNQFPREFQIRYHDNMENKLENIKNTIYKNSREKGLEVREEVACKYLQTVVFYKEGKFEPMGKAFTGFKNHYDLYIITQEEYKGIWGKGSSLLENETMIYFADNNYHKDTIKFGKLEFKVKDKLKNDTARYLKYSTMSLFTSMILVVPNDTTAKNIYSEIGGQWEGFVGYYGFDVKGGKDSMNKFFESMSGMYTSNGVYKFMWRKAEAEELYSMYGGVFFIGIFLGLLFLMATALIIYYKQISEGFEDRERYIIMEKVGLGSWEIKDVIKSQVLKMFFLPIVMAIIHMIFASKIILRFLGFIITIETRLYILSTGITIITFCLVYTIVYLITSKEYYKIVRNE